MAGLYIAFGSILMGVVGGTFTAGGALFYKAGLRACVFCGAVFCNHGGEQSFYRK